MKQLDDFSFARARLRREPLIVGLQIYLGESPIVAKEILEISQDVAEQIRQLQDEWEKTNRFEA